MQSALKKQPSNPPQTPSQNN
jgi:kinesin family protein 12